MRKPKYRKTIYRIFVKGMMYNPKKKDFQWHRELGLCGCRTLYTAKRANDVSLAYLEKHKQEVRVLRYVWKKGKQRKSSYRWEFADGYWTPKGQKVARRYLDLLEKIEKAYVD